MITITFITHSTSIDNERKLASGHNDIALSEPGIQQARECGEYYRETPFAAIFCSDLQRSYRTGEIAFGERGIPIVRDARLRECDYGDMTQQPTSAVEEQKLKRISEPFPNGESFQMAVERVKSFLDEIREPYDGKPIMIIGHRATSYGLQYCVQKKSLEQIIQEPFQWRRGWIYHLE